MPTKSITFVIDLVGMDIGLKYTDKIIALELHVLKQILQIRTRIHTRSRIQTQEKKLIFVNLFVSP